MLFRTFVFVSVLFVAAVSLAAQHPIEEQRSVAFFNHAFGMHQVELGGVPDEVLQKAKTVLNLSEVQVAAVKALLNMRAQTTQQIFQEAEAAQMKLHDVTNQNNASATEIGTAFLAVQTAHQRVRAATEKFQTDFRALLNDEQRSVLARLNAASEQISTLSVLGVLEGSHGEMGMPFHAAFPAHAGAVRIK